MNVNTKNPSDDDLKKIALVCFRSSTLDSWLSRFPSIYRPEELDFSKDTLPDTFVTRFSDGYRTAQAGKTKYQGSQYWYVNDSIFLKGFEIGSNPDLIAKEAELRKTEYQAALKKQAEWDRYVVQNEANRIANERARPSYDYGYGNGYRSTNDGCPREPVNAQERAEEQSFIWGNGSRPSWW